MFLDTLGAECLEAFLFDTVIEAYFIGMVPAGVGQGTYVGHGAVLDLGDTRNGSLER